MTENIDAIQAPSPEGLADFVKLSRGLAGWKQNALAYKAGVSLSTIQRVERGEAVGPEALERIGRALGQEPGAMTRPRRTLTEAEAVASLVEKYRWLEDVTPVAVAPLRTHRQLRVLSACAFLIVDSNLPEEAEPQIDGLKEWLDLYSFVRAEASGLLRGTSGRDLKLRRLGDDVLEAVRALERDQHAACLVGTYRPEHKVDWLKDADIGLVAIRSRTEDPAAARRRTMLAPKTIDMDEVMRQSFEDEAG
ncbi:MAG: hypothetical protein ABS77_05090 [Phenylobacterium sp. SCN 69-14]|nr:MAG: hypothetical protein ABS77_05090 [Phenylobacterium sp. SCN 69-14]